MTLHTCSECVFDVEPGWVDDTAYVFDHGELSVLIGPFTPRASYAGKLDKAVQTFRVATAEYELVERSARDKPVGGAEILAHRIGGSVSRFELNLFWPLGETIWVCRVRGPWDSEDACRQVLEHFITTYEPIDPTREHHE